jgi:hypothetical protein
LADAKEGEDDAEEEVDESNQQERKKEEVQLWCKGYTFSSFSGWIQASSHSFEQSIYLMGAISQIG